MAKKNTFSSLDEKMVEIVRTLGKGTLSSRYILRFDNQDSFTKIYARTKHISGGASRQIIKNEIVVQEYLLSQGENTYYKGYGEVGDQLAVFFEDIATPRKGKDLHDYLDVKDEISSELEELDPDDKDYVSKKDTILQECRRNVHVDNLLGLKVADIVHIIHKISTQADHYHNLSTDQVKGIVHFDISPGNIMVFLKNVGGNVILNEAMLMDFGIAREKGVDIKKLFKKSKVKLGGTYYNTVKDIACNSLYHPPDIDKYETAEPSYDTYNISNMLCLFLTGKLMEYWDYSVKEGNDKGQFLESVLTNSIQSRLEKEGYSSKDDESMKLANIIIRGTSEKDQRYQSAKELADVLDTVIFPVTELKVKLVELDYTVPPKLKDYQITSPPLSKVYKKKWEQLYGGLEKIADVKPVYDSKTIHSFTDVLNHSIKSENERIKKEKDKIKAGFELRSRQKQNVLHYFKWGVLAIGAGAALLLAYKGVDYVIDKQRMYQQQQTIEEK